MNKTNDVVTLDEVSVRVTFEEIYDALDAGQKQHMANKLYKDDGIVPQQLPSIEDVLLSLDDFTVAQLAAAILPRVGNQ